jgi:hypothetical protein
MAIFFKTSVGKIVLKKFFGNVWVGNGMVSSYLIANTKNTGGFSHNNPVLFLFPPTDQDHDHG